MKKWHIDINKQFFFLVGAGILKRNLLFKLVLVGYRMAIVGLKGGCTESDQLEGYLKIVNTP